VRRVGRNGVLGVAGWRARVGGWRVVGVLAVVGWRDGGVVVAADGRDGADVLGVAVGHPGDVRVERHEPSR
jgi:hypothetical protein